MHLHRRFASVVTALALVVAGAGVVYAVWSGTASGNGTAGSLSTNGTATILAVAPTPDLWPGCTACGDVFFQIKNSNPFAISVSSAAVSFSTATISACGVTGAPAACPTGAPTSTCDAAGMPVFQSPLPSTFTLANGGATPTVLAGGTTSITQQLNNVLTLPRGTGVDNSCQNTWFLVSGFSITYQQN